MGQEKYSNFQQFLSSVEVEGLTTTDNLIVGTNFVYGSGGNIVAGTNNTSLSGFNNLIAASTDTNICNTEIAAGGGFNSIILGSINSKIDGNKSTIINSEDSVLYQNRLTSIISSSASRVENSGLTTIFGSISSYIGTPQQQDFKDRYSAIISGIRNCIVGATIDHAFIFGGCQNSVLTPNATNSVFGGVIGGSCNAVKSPYTLILGGCNGNVTEGTNNILINEICNTITSSNYNTFIGGCKNTVAAACNSVGINSQCSYFTCKQNVAINDCCTNFFNSSGNLVASGNKNTITGNDNTILGSSSNNITGELNLIAPGNNNNFTSKNLIAGDNNTGTSNNFVFGSSNTVRNNDKVLGSSNSIQNTSCCNVILGSNNTAIAGFTNMVILGDNITGNRSNTTFVNNISSQCNFFTSCLDVNRIKIGNSGDFTNSNLSSTIYGNITGINDKVSFNSGIATGAYSFAINCSIALGCLSFSSGFNTCAIGGYSHAEGGNTCAVCNGSHAEGNQAKACGTASHAEGCDTLTCGMASHAEGGFTCAIGGYSHAEGNDTKAYGDYSHAEGFNTFANGKASHSEGFNTYAVGGYSHAAGFRAFASQNYTYAWTDSNLGTTYQHVSTTRTGQYMVSASGGIFLPGNVGIGTDNNLNALTIVGSISGRNLTTSFGTSSATGAYSFAEGSGRAFGDYSHAEGVCTFAIGGYSHAEGVCTFAIGGYSHAEGHCTYSCGEISHVEGFSTIASGTASHAEGEQTHAEGEASHAEGELTAANGLASHAEGFQTTASADYSHAEGDQTHAEGEASHAEGGQTTASGDASHAEGGSTIASGSASHAEGINTVASGTASHAAGIYATAAQNFTYAWSDGNLSTASQNISTTRTGQYMVSASGGMFVPGKVGVGVDCFTTGLSSNTLTVAGTISAQNLVFSKSLTPNLPVPRIKLKGPTNTSIQYLTGGPANLNLNWGIANNNLSLINSPVLVVTDFTQEDLERYNIYLEMVIYKRRRSKGTLNMRGFSSYTAPGGNDIPDWGSSFWQRSGDTTNEIKNAVVRTNHIRILPVNLNTQVGVSSCLNGHFRLRSINYLNSNATNDGDFSNINLIVPFGSKNNDNQIGRRFPYSANYRPLYIAYRYICWLPENNNGRGQIISGPLSPTIRVANLRFPFFTNHYRSSLKGFYVCDLTTNPLFANNEFICSFC